jgi:hypothetical protein
LALVALTYLVALLILITRVSDMIRHGSPVAKYEDVQPDGWAPWISRPTRHLSNLFEFPVLYFALVALVVGAGLRDPLLVQLCWTYVGLRYLHAACQLLVNRLWLRTPIFMVGNLLLLAMWGHLALMCL